MKELLGRFRFGDFSAYFLPGLVMVAAFAMLAYVIGAESIGTALRSISFAEMLGIACAAYVCGAIISGSSYRLIAPIYAVTRFERYAEPRLEVRPAGLREAVEAALADVLGTGVGPGWSEDHFYLARTAVHERLPQTSAEAMRQNDIMRLRENMLLPVLTWSIVGFAHAILDYRPDEWRTALAAAAGTIVLTYVVIGRVACRSVDNRGREVREICVGFLIAYRMGLFKPALAPSADENVNRSTVATDQEHAKLSTAGPVAGSA